MDREALVWALVFSVPVGIGMTGYAAHVIRRGAMDPLALVAGATTALLLFALASYAFSRGSADEGREGGSLP